MMAKAAGRFGQILHSARGAPNWLIARISAVLWLRKCDAVGAGTRAFRRPHIENHGRMLIGQRVRLNSTWAPVELATGLGGVLQIDDGVFINYGTLVSARARVHIGANVML